MARAGRPGSIRGEAAARGVSEYQIRVERAAARGVTPSVGVGKPRKGEITLTQSRRGFLPAGPRSTQRARYRVYWIRSDGSLAGVQDFDRLPDWAEPGELYLNPFDADDYPEEDNLRIDAVTVVNR
jgi:hypothetical protein